jgi:hypothetical protein
MLWPPSGLKRPPTAVGTRANTVGIPGSDFWAMTLDAGGCGFAFRGGFFAILVDVAKSVNQLSEAK